METHLKTPSFYGSLTKKIPDPCCRLKAFKLTLPLPLTTIDKIIAIFTQVFKN